MKYQIDINDKQSKRMKF